MSSPYTLGIGAITSGTAASNDWGAIGAFLTTGAAIDATANHRPSRSIRFRFLTLVVSVSHSRWLEIIVQ